MSGADRLGRHALALPAAVVALAAHVARFGYAYGDGDHDELIPSVLARLDPALFRSDWLIGHVTGELNVRTAFVELVAAAGRVLPLPTAVAALHAAVFVATGAGVYALGVVLTRSRGAALAGAFGALAVVPAWTLGANAVVANLLTPEGVAWALSVPAVALFLRRRRVAAGVVFGVASWMHVLTGLLPALALGVVALWRTAERAPGETVRGLVAYGAAYALAAAPILVPIGLGQLGDAPGDGPSVLAIHAVFRNPFHHLLSAFPAGHHVRFWGLLALGAAGLWAMRRRGSAGLAPEVARLWAVVVTAGAVAAVFVEVVPVELVGKLQLFKLTVLANVVATLTAAGGAVALARRWLPAAAVRAAPAGVWLAGGAAAALLLGAAADQGPLADRVWSRAHAGTPVAAVEAWARAETPRDAVFAVPPSVSSFRTNARRALVANWHAFAFSDAAMRTWYARLQAVAPIRWPGPRADRKPLLDAAYAARTAAQWRAIGTRYGVDYVVAAPGAPALPFAVAHRVEDWTVYALGAAGP